MTRSAPSDNPELKLAFRLAEHTGANIFLTGKAGTGKTTFLRNLCASSSKRIIVAAPTGIAAINAHGTTLHSLLQLEFGPYLPGTRSENRKFSRRKLALLRSMDMLVIDEISMVRADLLDYVDDVLRRIRNPRLPFGGVQMLLIGDLQQLPPVIKEQEWHMLRDTYASPYFFHSHALAAAGYVTIELEKIYRQDDPEFIALLNGIRTHTGLEQALQTLNRRYIPGFKPDGKHPWIRLTTHNAAANEINEHALTALPGNPVHYTATVSGNFPEHAFPAAMKLTLKKGAQVMFIKNDASENKEYFNGMTGEVTELTDNSVTVKVSDRQATITVSAVTWENTRYDINPSTGEMIEVTEGTFSQIPLRPAWAITIHKSQGLTFSHAMIDASSSFAHGQAYVALSRCKNLEGIVLTAPLRIENIITDPTVENFMEAGRLNRPDGSTVSRLELEYVAALLDKLFIPDTIVNCFDTFHRIAEEAFHSTYTKLTHRYSEMSRSLAELRNVGLNFSATYRRMLASSSSLQQDSPLQERIHAGARYFLNALEALATLLADTPSEHDNAQLLKRLSRTREPLETETALSILMLRHLCSEVFSSADFIKTRARAIVEIEHPAKHKQKKKRKTTNKTSEEQPDNDIRNNRLFDALVTWRRSMAKANNTPAYAILSTKAIISIANQEPRSRRELLACKGIGELLASRHGDAILTIVEENS